jgi:hypothetical protein
VTAVSAVTDVRPSQDGEAFIAELTRLRNELRDVGSRLDEVETDLRRVLDDIFRDRWER